MMYRQDLLRGKLGPVLLVDCWLLDNTLGINTIYVMLVHKNLYL